MKVAAFVCTFGVSFSRLLAGQPGGPFKTIDLSGVKIAGFACQVKFRDGLSRVIWLDEQRLAVSSPWVRCSSAPRIGVSATAAVVFDVTGSVEATTRRPAVMSFSKGPRGTFAALSTGEIELLNAQLQRQQSIECPNSSEPCDIILAPNSAFDSEFAVCTCLDKERQACDFYRGWPAVPFRRTQSQPEDPYSHVVKGGPPGWLVGPGEMWFFHDRRLTASDANQVLSTVTSEDFVGTNDSGCRGQISAVEPRRLLVMCTGIRLDTDGTFDAIFGFSRVVIFDVSTRTLIKRIDGPSFISAAISPSGKKVAILKGGKVRLYEVN